MIRHDAPLPAQVDAGQLAELTRTRFPKAIGMNVVGSEYAVYFTDADDPLPADVGGWQAAVTAHVPAPLSAIEVERSGAEERLRVSYSLLRQWADDAEVVANQGASVTQVQHKVVIGRLGKLCDGLADFLLYLRVN